ncbi:MAG: S9 family peptidase, partial [Marinilabiliales bacterium]
MKILSLFVSLAIVCTLSHFSKSQETKKIELDDIYKKGTFRQEYVFGIRSMEDGDHYTTLEAGNYIVKYSYITGDIVDTIFSGKKVNSKLAGKIEDYEFNSDKSKILLATDIEHIYRHSFKAQYFVYDIKEDKLVALSENGKQQLASFSPSGNKVAFVRENNIFIKYLQEDKESQITINGKINEIINGAPDWVYEEEFGFSKGYEWSPNGTYIAYYKFDESKVKQYNMPIYGKLYPELYEYKYPKAGEDNSTVSIHVYDLRSKGTHIVNTGLEEDIYIPRIKWTKDNETLAILRLNRLQNKLDILFADASTGASKTVYTEENEYYIDITDNWYFLDNKKSFLFTSEKSGYNHIYEISTDGKNVQQITHGKWDVTALLGYSEKDKTIYYESAEESPMRRHIYSIDTKGSTKTKLTKKDGTNEAAFSKSFKYFINYNSSANTPYFITLNDNSGKVIRELKTNKKTIETFKEYGFAKKEFFTFKSEGYELNGWIIKPLNFDNNKKYPVFMYVYGGPGSQTVTDSYSYDLAWHQMLAQNGYIIVSVDNRGTGARGEKFKKMTYLQLGKYETEDQINAAKYLGGLPYVDKDRIGIFGWSYGGYMSSLCMTKGADYFKARI